MLFITVIIATREVASRMKLGGETEGAEEWNLHVGIWGKKESVKREVG